MVFRRSQANSTAESTLQAIWASKRIDAVGPATFMRFETEGVVTEHRWLDGLRKSPLAKLVFRREGKTFASSPRPHGYNIAFRV